jgi:hypothetical protein
MTQDLDFLMRLRFLDYPILVRYATILRCDVKIGKKPHFTAVVLSLASQAPYLAA